MSQPKRYSPALEPGRGSNFNGLEVSMREDLAGKWVSLSDYAALATENERLRKAGDAMAGVIGLPLNKTQVDAHISAWNAAKEGRDAK